MKIGRLWVDGFKNLHQCDIKLADGVFLNAVIGGNGSGKSNLIEAILHILTGFYFQKPPPFEFEFLFEAQGRKVLLRRRRGDASAEVDGIPIPLRYFAKRLRGGPSQVYYPELTFVYYSGECERIHQLIKRYQKHFDGLTRDAETDSHRPLFVQSSGEHSQIILLALFAHRRVDFLERLALSGIESITIVVRSPESFDSQRHEPKLWDTTGAVRRILAAIDDTAESQQNERRARGEEGQPGDEASYVETRSYRFIDEGQRRGGLRELADRLGRSGDNLYIALEHLRARKLLLSVDYRLRGRGTTEPFTFDQLSEGEKQLIAVIGAIGLTNQRDNLVLLDEPDTHLNPHWSWDYPEMLTDAFEHERRSRSTVLMATHDPVMISGLTREQVWLAHAPSDGTPMFTHPYRNPRGQGIANLLCSSEFFGLPSSLDKETHKLLTERLKISVKNVLTDAEKARLRELNQLLEILPGVSERDPMYVRYLREIADMRLP